MLFVTRMLYNNVICYLVDHICWYSCGGAVVSWGACIEEMKERMMMLTWFYFIYISFNPFIIIIIIYRLFSFITSSLIDIPCTVAVKFMLGSYFSFVLLNKSIFRSGDFDHLYSGEFSEEVWKIYFSSYGFVL